MELFVFWTIFDHVGTRICMIGLSSSFFAIFTSILCSFVSFYRCTKAGFTRHIAVDPHAHTLTHRLLLLHTINYSISLLFHFFVHVNIFCSSYRSDGFFFPGVCLIFFIEPIRFFFSWNRLHPKKSKRKISDCPKIILH